MFDLIFFVLAGNKDNNKISDEFEIQQDTTTDRGVSCPLGLSGNFHRLVMGKCCDHSSAFIFGWIFPILAGMEDINESFDEFDFLTDPTTDKLPLNV